MSDLTYIPTEPPATPFEVGDHVEVLDRDHTVLSARVIVKRNAKGSVKTNCGRWWTKDGRWEGEFRSWPFPTIRRTSTFPSQPRGSEAE